MAAFIKMSWRRLPPVGSPVSLVGDAACLPHFTGYRPIWVNSGTAALALALVLAIRRRRREANPQVILPAYGCPDLVAAAVFAGAKPVLVDIGVEDPSYDLESLKEAVNDETVAVVAVNFLGIRERLTDIRSILANTPGVALVEDSAQWYPESLGSALESGDVFTLSFGRGKPVNLLGGGALFVSSTLDNDEAIRSIVSPSSNSRSMLSWKMRAYNLALATFAYGLVSRLPFMALGRTKLRTLTAIHEMDAGRLALLASNVANRQASSMQVAERLKALVPMSMNLPANLGGRSGRLLRFPVLCRDGGQRDSLYAALQEAGLGASGLYLRALPDIPGVVTCAGVAGEFPNARQFATRLLTLPVHSGVSARDVNAMDEVISRVLGQ